MREKLIEHGYPKQMVDNWDDKYCKSEWNNLKSFLAEHHITLK